MSKGLATAASATPKAGSGGLSLANVIALTAFLLLGLTTQIVLRRELGPGEFGLLNALLGIVIVLVVPLAMLRLLLRRPLAVAEVGPVLNRAGLAWGTVCVVLLFVVLPQMQLPRVALQFYTLLAVGAVLLAVCGRAAAPLRWAAVIGVSGAVTRLLVSAWCGLAWPVAESGLGALILGGTLIGLPALRDQPVPLPFTEVWRRFRAGLKARMAMMSLGVAFALFINADRIAVQVDFCTPNPGAVSFIDYGRLDEYQAAGLLARFALFALVFPLLAFYRQRAVLAKTTYASLHWLWIHLVALVVATVALAFGGGFEQFLFGGEPDVFLSGFAGAVFVLGLVQAVGVFALASRRYVECFVLAGCSVGYTIFLFVPNNPYLLPGCMTGGALGTLALVLLVGVVRYARSHP